MPLLRPVLALVSALALSVTLTACGSSAWTAESVDAAMLTSDDFDFDVSRAEEETAFEDAEEGDTLFWDGDDCTANAKISEALSKGEMLSTAGFEERNDGQSDFNVKQQVFQLESPEAVTEVMDLITKAIKDDGCSYSDYISANSAQAYIDYEFTNIRDLQDAFGLTADASLVWDLEYTAIFSGIFDITIEEEGGGIVATNGNSILLLTYETDTDEDVDESITRRDLEDTIEKSLLRFFPQ